MQAVAGAELDLEEEPTADWEALWVEEGDGGASEGARPQVLQ